jgi:hypothetical protein
MKTSEQITEIAKAMAKAQGEMRPAIKDATNPAFRSKYADLTSVWDACRGPLTGNGITVWQDVETHADGIAVTTRLAHVSGQWVEFGPLVLPLAKKDAHGVGSATSYAKRYALSAAVGIVSDEDDDGNAAVQRPAPQAEQAPAKPAGFDDWWTDMTATADTGTKALQDAWKKSRADFRDFATKTRNAGLEALKAKAAKVREAASA